MVGIPTHALGIIAFFEQEEAPASTGNTVIHSPYANAQPAVRCRFSTA